MSEFRSCAKVSIFLPVVIRAAVRKTPLLIKQLLSGLCLLLIILVPRQSLYAADEGEVRFKRIPTRFIAALGEPSATYGNNANSWGLWSVDPGPRGVRLDRYDRLVEAGGVAPARWKFDSTDWWLEEHGLIMEPPEFPVAPGKYMVTGDREVTSILTIHPVKTDGSQRWELDDGATLHDVTHLACRSARYTPVAGENSCTPASAQASAFPVTPGGPMPPVKGCNKQDYTVLLVIGVAVEE